MGRPAIPYEPGTSRGDRPTGKVSRGATGKGLLRHRPVRAPLPHG